MSKIKEVTRFQTTDNRLFETLGEAKKHQDLKDEVNKIMTYHQTAPLSRTAKVII